MREGQAVEGQSLRAQGPSGLLSLLGETASPELGVGRGRRPGPRGSMAARGVVAESDGAVALVGPAQQSMKSECRSHAALTGILEMGPQEVSKSEADPAGTRGAHWPSSPLPLPPFPGAVLQMQGLPFVPTEVGTDGVLDGTSSCCSQHLVKLLGPGPTLSIQGPLTQDSGLLRTSTPWAVRGELELSLVQQAGPTVGLKPGWVGVRWPKSGVWLSSGLRISSLSCACPTAGEGKHGPGRNGRRCRPAEGGESALGRALGVRLACETGRCLGCFPVARPEPQL